MNGSKRPSRCFARKALALSVLLTCARVHAGAVSWNVDADGQWTTVTNWTSTPQLPAPSDDVTIDRSAGNFLITLASGVQTINSLFTTERLTLTGGTLSVTTTMQVNNTLTLNGGTLQNGTLSTGVGGSILALSGTFSDVAIRGDLLFNTTSANAVLTGTTRFTAARLSANNATPFLATGYTLNDLVQAEGTASGTRVLSLAYGNAGTVTLGAAAVVRLAAGAGGGLNLSNYSAAVLVNNGLITAEATGQVLTINNSTLINHGILQVTAGTMTLSAANWSNAGTVTGTGGSLNLGGTFDATGGIGTFATSALAVNVIGVITNTGNALTLGAGTGTWNLAGGTINNGSVNETGGALLLPTSSGGTLANVQINGDLLFNTTSANAVLTGTTRFTAARLSANNATPFLATGYTLNDLVQAEGTASGTRVLSLAYGNAGTVTLGAAAVVRLAAGAGGGLNLSNYSAAVLVNNGLITAEATGQVLTINPSTLINHGILQVTAGTMTLSAANWSNAGTVTGTGGSLNLGGTFDATGGIGTFATSALAVNVIGVITNTGNALTLGAGTGTWNLAGGTINNGSVNETGGALLLPTSSGGTLANVQINGDLLFNTTSANAVLTGTTRFTAARLSANNATPFLATGYTLNDLVQAEGTASGTRVLSLAYGNAGTVTLGAAAVVRLAAGAGGGLNLSNYSAAVLVNNGLITAEATGQVLTINPSTFSNNGTLQALNGSLMTVSVIPTNFASGTLTGGTWNVFDNSTLNLAGLASNITTNAASITLSGTGSTFTQLTNGLATNNGDLHFLANRSFTAVGALTNNGLLEVGGGTLTATAITNNIPGILQIGIGGATGSLNTPTLANSGLLLLNRAGTLAVAAAITGTGTLTHAGTGTTTLSKYQGTGPINVNAGTLAFGTTAGARHTPAVLIQASAVSVAAGTTLDLSNHDMLIHGGSSAAIESKIGAAYFSGLWNKPGITSSTSQTNAITSLGIMSGTDYNTFSATPGTFDGTPVASTDTVIKFTYVGDINLDGLVNDDDFSLFSTAYFFTHTGNYAQGDFNFDGLVNDDDFSLFSTNYFFPPATTLGEMSLVSQPEIENQNSIIENLPTPTPEPASLLLVSLGTLNLLRRKRP